MRKTDDRVTNKPVKSAQATHLARRALIYVRQSVGGSLAKGNSSTQCAAAHTRALEIGWSLENIQVIADHEGPHGGRPGYAELLDRIRSDEVGVLFVSDLSRIGRDAHSVADFMVLLIERNVLLVVNGRVVAPEALPEALTVLRGERR